MNLDSLPQLQALDKSGVYLSITSLPDQMLAAWQGVHSSKILPEYKLVKNVVLAGMGGSALGGHVVQALFSKDIRVPFEVVSGYNLPRYVGEGSLVILSSYSGNTEETIAAFHQAQKAKACMYCLCTGGKLAKLAQNEEVPGFIFDPKHNPSGMPRMALGYSIFAIVALLSNCGIISMSDDQVNLLIETTRQYVIDFSARVPRDQNPAKLLSHKLKGSVPMIISSEHLPGVAHAFKNQINENAKSFSINFDIPELDHHLIEGLVFPPNAKKALSFLFVESPHYSDRVKIRYSITQEIVEKNNYPFLVYKTSGKNKLEEAFELLTLGEYISFYLAMLYQIDPGPIPWIDYLKEKLSK